MGDVWGKEGVDLACGEGFYTRKIKQGGALEFTGVDISGAMVRLAEEERLRPLGCKYLNQDVGELELSQPVDVVVAMYLLNYAQTKGELLRFCQVADNILRPGGRFVGFNDNTRNPPGETDPYAKYGFEKKGSNPPKEGNVILYKFMDEDGQQFEVKNYFLKPETYQWTSQKAGFVDFQWALPYLPPSQQDNPFWDDFMSNPPLIGLRASKD